MTVVTILGPVPPPRGGVSIHVLRLQHLLAAEGSQVRVLPFAGHLASRRWQRFLGTVGQWLALIGTMPAARGGAIHLHYAHLYGLLALTPWVLTLRGRWILTVHSVRLFSDLAAAAAWQRWLARHLLGRFSLAVCVRQEIAEQFLALGLAGPEICVMPAFLPPAPAELDPALLAPSMVAAMRQRRADGTLQLACAAYYLGPGYGRDDLYGVEMLVEMLAEVVPDLGRSIHLHVLVSNPPVGSAAEAARAIASQAAGVRGLTIEVFVNEPLVPVLAQVDAFLRPTREDGDSVAIREALALSRPVWASDVVTRPAGCALFCLDDPAAGRLSLVTFLSQLNESATVAAATYRGPDERYYREFVARLVDDAAPTEVLRS